MQYHSLLLLNFIEGVPETTFQQMSAQQFPKSVYKRRNYQQHHMVSNSIAASQDKLDFQNKEHIQAVPHSQLHSESLPSITTSKQGSAIQDIIIVPLLLMWMCMCI